MASGYDQSNKNSFRIKKPVWPDDKKALQHKTIRFMHAENDRTRKPKKERQAHGENTGEGQASINR